VRFGCGENAVNNVSILNDPSVLIPLSGTTSPPNASETRGTGSPTYVESGVAQSLGWWSCGSGLVVEWLTESNAILDRINRQRPMSVLKFLDTDEAAERLGQLSEKSAVVLNCISKEACADLSDLADQLQYRNAQPVTGPDKAPVYQDFELDYEIPQEHCFWEIAAELQSVFKLLLEESRIAADDNDDFRLNDLIVQRYPPGCAGISPHRDHIEYRMVILILLLSGDGDFRIHPERDENEGQIIDFHPGQLLMMGAPGLAPGFVRPFHSVRNFSTVRRTIGMRYDRRLAHF
jgi:hypothetical protein